MPTSNKTLRKPSKRIRWRNWLKANQNRNPGWKAERVVVARESNQREHSSAPNNNAERQQKFRIGGLIPWVFSPRVCPPLGRRSIKNTDQVVFHTLFVSFCRFVCITLSLYYERKTGEYSLRMKMRSNRVTHWMEKNFAHGFNTGAAFAFAATTHA